MLEHRLAFNTEGHLTETPHTSRCNRGCDEARAGALHGAHPGPRRRRPETVRHQVGEGDERRLGLAQQGSASRVSRHRSPTGGQLAGLLSTSCVRSFARRRRPAPRPRMGPRVTRGPRLVDRSRLLAATQEQDGQSIHALARSSHLAGLLPRRRQIQDVVGDPGATPPSHEVGHDIGDQPRARQKPRRTPPSTRRGTRLVGQDLQVGSARPRVSDRGLVQLPLAAGARRCARGGQRSRDPGRQQARAKKASPARIARLLPTGAEPREPAPRRRESRRRRGRGRQVGELDGGRRRQHRVRRRSLSPAARTRGSGADASLATRVPGVTSARPSRSCDETTSGDDARRPRAWRNPGLRSET